MDFTAYLRNERIFVDDPYEQENLRPRTKIEIGKSPAVFDNYYQVSGERVFCHVCGGHRHFKGITGVLDDGTRILFGRKCAADYFGPEVARLHGAELRRRTSDAYARYKILSIKAELEKISDWLASYRPLVTQCAQGWIDIKGRYPKPFDEITDHLRKNNGRFVLREHIEIKSSEASPTRMFQDTILTAIKNAESIPNLTQLSQQLSLVDVFLDAVAGLRHQPNRQSINNLNRMFIKMVRAAEVIDSSLAFTHDFFSPQKLDAMNAWSDLKRKEKLVDVNDATQRNLGKLFSKIMRSGFPLPGKPLRDTILEIEPMKILAGENAVALELEDSLALKGDRDGRA
jgi:hypothetical protein